MSKKKAIILLSGGLDSTTCLAIAQSENYDCYALSFRYGQKHSSELEAAQRIAKNAKVKLHKIIDLNLGSFGGSALTDDSIEVPKGGTEGIPVTYVPARNTVFLSIALAWAEVLEADFIFAGVNAVDYSGYPDCRPEYIDAFQKMADLATKAGIEGRGVKLITPLIDLTKVEIIQRGHSLGVDYSQTVSCYDADVDGKACGECDSCLIRKNAFESAQVSDPTIYHS
ncbi:7-cyano-7-deazaguanine synthase QueC [Aliikangiella coralliicola]|uniref:7-cyano-7-deazaguanine synthase n=1 Tax=Aliikangiella coralliicola TaxID=2592383 RepID=A0A545UBW1_9GAMM|nr:7-cyano-7-deazaguanine synthase QueC [Aliikangiella coralliicola]TQV86913.1 7-cyano-7-deazaguanine synthase QueC [Aliikangiella coralliicola]